MRILITGGCGFIGSAVVRQLIRETDASLVNLDLLTPAASMEALEEAGAHPRHVLLRGDIRDPAAVREAFERCDPDAVLHLAAESHVDRSIDAPSVFVTTNVLGTSVMLEAALAHWRALPGARRDAFRFVHVSTDEVFGSLGPSGRFTEESPYRPHAPYAATKAASDHLARAWHDTYGLPVMVTCGSNTYGSWQFPEKLIPLAALKALLGEPIPLYGTGDNVRDWLHVEDHARLLRRALDAGAPGATYLGGGGNERRNIDVVRAICRWVDELRPEGAPRERLITFVEDRPSHDLRYALDVTRTTADLGWRPKADFDEGLRATIEWYIAHESWWQRIRGSAYGLERLGLPRA